MAPAHDESAPIAQLLFRARAGGGLCDGLPCWKPLAGKGYRYRRRTADGGIATMSMTIGVPGKASMTVSGKGPNLISGQYGMPAPPFPRPLRAQVQTGTTCFEASFTAADASRNAAGRFKAKTP